MEWTINPDDLGIIVLVAIIAVWALTHKILNNRRRVVRHVLHGTVTYTIKGYSGGEAERIAETLRVADYRGGESQIIPDELEHRGGDVSGTLDRVRQYNEDRNREDKTL